MALSRYYDYSQKLKAMIKIRKRKVYKDQETGKTNLTDLRGKAGVYTIWEGSKRVYIGHSRSDLYKTILRHFQEWRDRAQPTRISYRGKLNKHTYRVSGFLTKPTDAIPLETELLLKYRPRDNKGKINDVSRIQRNRAKERMRKAINKPPEDWQGFNYADNGELIGPDGEVLF